MQLVQFRDYKKGSTMLGSPPSLYLSPDVRFMITWDTILSSSFSRSIFPWARFEASVFLRFALKHGSHRSVPSSVVLD